VRRAGLRPGLDRSFGYAQDQLGTVVAQEPPPGSDLGRNGLVTLYVAAPGPAAPDGDGGDGLPAPRDPDVDAAPPAAVSQKPSPRLEPRTRRPRKPRPAARAPGVPESPPAPVAPGLHPPIQALENDAAADQAQDWESWSAAQSSGERVREEVFDESAGAELAQEELVVLLDDLFAGRVDGSPAWRRVYPRRPARGLRAGLRARHWRSTTKGGM
jgi:hypothetical protein